MDRVSDPKLLETLVPWEWPPDAADTIRTALSDRGRPRDERLFAAELAGDLVVMDDDMAERLLAIVRDPGEGEDVRGQAAISLGPVLEQTDIHGFDGTDPYADPSITEKTFEEIKLALRQIHDDESVPKLVRRRALEASVRATQDWLADAVRAAYARDDEDWKLTATFCMRWMPGFDREILRLLKSDNRDVHYEAVRAAGARGLDGAWPHIVALLESPATEKTLLLGAIEAAGDIRPRKAPRVLADLGDSEDEEIVEAVDEALAMAQGAAMAEDEDEEEEEDSDLLS